MPLDGNQMKQAIYNLIRNAVQAMAGKGKAVREYARGLGKDEAGLSSEELAVAKSLPAA